MPFYKTRSTLIRAVAVLAVLAILVLGTISHQRGGAVGVGPGILLAAETQPPTTEPSLSTQSIEGVTRLLDGLLEDLDLIAPGERASFATYLAVDAFADVNDFKHASDLAARLDAEGRESCFKKIAKKAVRQRDMQSALFATSKVEKNRHLFYAELTQIDAHDASVNRKIIEAALPDVAAIVSSDERTEAYLSFVRAALEARDPVLAGKLFVAAQTSARTLTDAQHSGDLFIDMSDVALQLSDKQAALDWAAQAAKSQNCPLERLAIREAELNKVQAARSHAAQVTHPPMAALATAFAKSGNVEAAYAIADKFTFSEKTSILSAIVKAQIETGDLAGARQTISAIHIGDDPATLDVEIARSQIILRDLPAARDTLQLAAKKADADLTLVIVDLEQTSGNDIAVSKEILRASATRHHDYVGNVSRAYLRDAVHYAMGAMPKIAVKQISVADAASAAKTYGLLLDLPFVERKYDVLDDKAMAERLSGDISASNRSIDEALENAKSLDSTSRPYAFSSIVKALASMGDYQKAKMVVGLIDANQHLTRAELYATISSLSRISGHQNLAVATLRLADNEVANANPGAGSGDADWGLTSSMVCAEWVRLGDLKHARSIVMALDNPAMRAELRSRTVTLLMENRRQ